MEVLAFFAWMSPFPSRSPLPPAVGPAPAFAAFVPFIPGREGALLLRDWTVDLLPAVFAMGMPFVSAVELQPRP